MIPLYFAILPNGCCVFVVFKIPLVKYNSFSYFRQNYFIMSIREQIIEFINEQFFRVGFTAPLGYSTELGFKISNVDSKSTDSFSVNSLEEAEDLVISFISTATKGDIFINDNYSEDKPLFLRVKIILPEPF